MKWLVAVIAILFLTPTVAKAQRPTFTVGTASATRGQKATGVIEVPPGSDGGLSIPVAVFHGAKPGPVLALVSVLTGPNTLQSLLSRRF